MLLDYESTLKNQVECRKRTERFDFLKNDNQNRVGCGVRTSLNFYKVYLWTIIDHATHI